MKIDAETKYQRRLLIDSYLLAVHHLVDEMTSNRFAPVLTSKEKISIEKLRRGVVCAAIDNRHKMRRLTGKE